MLEITLTEFKELAIRAHQGTSFVPDERAVQTIKLGEISLEHDLDFIKEANDEIKTDYISKFKNHYSNWLLARSRVISPMISGPANFPIERMEKLRRYEQSAFNKFMNFRDKAKKGILKSLTPPKTNETELERYKSELESLLKNHELMKEGNRRIKLAKKNNEDITDYLTETFGIQPHMIEWTMRWGFGLQSNLAKIKRIEERIQLLERKEQLSNEVEQKEYEFGDGKVVYDYKSDRLKIFHNTKPDSEVISNLKRNGFKWSPSNKCWQRQLTQNAINSLRNIPIKVL